MKYHIKEKQDLSGITYTVRFPSEDLDEKALYTIQEDRPNFLLPFRCRVVDGEAECTYLPENGSKLQYRFGAYPPPTYVAFWENVLRPLLDCGDWFMNPFSFVLDYHYMFTDPAGKNIKYIYIPSLSRCSDYDELKQFAVELSEHNSCTDSALEMKALRAIMQNFQPKQFLKIISENSDSEHILRAVEQPTNHITTVRKEGPAPRSKAEKSPVLPSESSNDLKPQPSPLQQPEPSHESSSMYSDIVINMGGTQPEKQKSSGFGFLSFKKTKAKESIPEREKPRKKKQESHGKSKRSKEIILGAAEDKPYPSKGSGNGGFVLSPVEAGDVNDSKTVIDGGVLKNRFVLIGDRSLPSDILVDITVGEVFTIGRYDVSVGYKQCTFEFAESTPAVSRRHAAMEKREDGSFSIVDTTSSAGTFVNGEKLTPNVPYTLHRGDRVSFGTAGANYIWEEA